MPAGRPTHSRKRRRSRTLTPVDASNLPLRRNPKSGSRDTRRGACGNQVLIYFDSTMASYIERLADFLVELTNDAMADSFIPLSLELAGLKSIKVDDATLNKELLDAMQKCLSRHLDHDQMMRLNIARICSQRCEMLRWLAEDESGGIASRGGEFVPSTISVTRYSSYQPGEPFYPSYTFAHEIGHNLGARHARYWQYTQEEMQNSYGFLTRSFLIERLWTHNHELRKRRRMGWIDIFQSSRD